MTSANSKPLERHNTSVDEVAAEIGMCGQRHLPTGRTCILPASHRGSCEFTRPDVAQKVVQDLRGDEPDERTPAP